MSVEKYRPVFEDGIIKHEPKPYTQILNDVLARCVNLRALGLWCHFQSKPENWVVSVQYIQNHFKIGRDVAYDILRYLLETNLMDKIRAVKEDGTFGQTSYVIKNGTEFQPLPEISVDKSPRPEKQEMVKQPLPDLPDTENPTTTNNRNTTNERKNQKLLASPDYKKLNGQKPAWADQKAPFADVTKQTTSFKPLDPNAPLSAPSPILEEFMNKKYTKETANDPTELPAGTDIQPEMAKRTHSGAQGAAIAPEGGQGIPPTFRSRYRLLAARSACLQSEAPRVASKNG